MNSFEEHKKMAWELFKVSYANYAKGLDAEILVEDAGNTLATYKTNKKGSRTLLIKGDIG